MPERLASFAWTKGKDCYGGEMVMRMLWGFFLAAGFFLWAGCGVAPMLNLPAQKENFVAGKPNPGDAFIGSWHDSKDGRTLTVSPVKDTAAVFALTVTDKPNRDGNNLSPLPLIGIPVRYQPEGELFFLVFADLGKVRESAKTSELLPVMARPYFYLVRPEISADGKLVLSMVSWTKKENDKTVATDPGVRLQSDSLVLNTTDELVNLIKAKKYELTEPVVFERRSGAEGTPDK